MRDDDATLQVHEPKVKEALYHDDSRLRDRSVEFDQPVFPIARLPRQVCYGNHGSYPRSAPYEQRVGESLHHVPPQIESLGGVLLELSDPGRVLSVSDRVAQRLQELRA
jgi:hypothetical protein